MMKLFLVTVVAILGCSETVSQTTAVAEAELSNTVNVEIFVESKCPFSTKFIHTQLGSAWELFGKEGLLNISLIPFGNGECKKKGEDYECKCQHGDSECQMNQLMGCVIQYYPQQNLHIPIFSCIQGKKNFKSALDSCLTGIDDKKVRECALGSLGRQLHAKFGDRTNALVPIVEFVPWVIINGKYCSDAQEHLVKNICKDMQSPPEQCKKFL